MFYTQFLFFLLYFRFVMILTVYRSKAKTQIQESIDNVVMIIYKLVSH